MAVDPLTHIYKQMKSEPTQETIPAQSRYHGQATFVFPASHMAAPTRFHDNDLLLNTIYTEYRGEGNKLLC